MTTMVLVRRFLADYARNPVNLLTLVLVPVVFVVVAAGPLADAAKLLGGASGDLAVETATAGWAAGFLAGIAMYFQITAARDADRRLVISGLRPARLVGARLLTGLGLALIVAVAALVALQLRTGIASPARAAAGTVMFAIIYLAIGAMVGALVRNPVNGTVVILFVWIVDVFFGPTLSGADRVATRVLPTHFVSLWMVDLPSRHGGRLGDFGLALSWTLGAVVVAWAVIAGTSRVARNRRRAPPGSVGAQLRTAVRMALREWRRNPALWALFVVVPAVFILLSDAITPHGSMAVGLVENGRRVTGLFDPAHIHAGTMAPIAVASLATLAGLFVVLDSRAGDQRLALAGMRVPVLLASRLAVVVLAALLATGISLAVTATVFQAHQWVLYAAASVLIALTYGMLGVLIGPIFGRVSGVFIAFLVPFLDLGIAQSPMLRGEPPGWADYLPGYGGARLFIDGALSSGFDETRA
ncbi:MAG TPA: ABC transporter permease, partial [Actinomycetes bacterium]|nr:ABC transporter permease [Actinomycetes bacterium]